MEVKETELIDHFTVKLLAEHIRERLQGKHDQLPCEIECRVPDWGKILTDYKNIHLPRSRFPHTLILNIVKTFVRCSFRLEAEGIENLPNSQVILASNHQCFFNGFILARFLSNNFLRNTYVYVVEKHLNSAFRRFVADTSNLIIVNVNRALKLSLQKMAAALQHMKLLKKNFLS